MSVNVHLCMNSSGCTMACHLIQSPKKPVATITDISEPRYLIVTADDLCMTEGITEGNC
jgi:hypothetical protein